MGCGTTAPPPPWWLKPGSMLYAAVSGGRRALYARSLRKSVRLGRPVVVVGNLSVGGTGKTPLVCWLARRLSEAGLRPGVVTRGHGGSSRGVRLVGPGHDPAVSPTCGLLRTPIPRRSSPTKSRCPPPSARRWKR